MTDTHFKNNKRILLYIFLIALFLRIVTLIGVSLVFKSTSLNDDFEYGVIARSLLQGKGYSAPVVANSAYGQEKQITSEYRPTADQLPFYPMTLALAYSLFPPPVSFWVIKLLQSIFSSATCVILFLIAARLFNRRVATIAGALSVFYPIFLLNNTRLYPETFLAFWLSLTVLYLFIVRDTPSLKNQIIAGILLGITLLNSNVIIPTLPFIGLWLLLLPGQWKIKLQRLVLVLVTSFLIVSPWLVRNYFIFHEFPLMKSTMGLNFWLGNNPQATGTFFLPNGESIYSTLPQEFYQGFSLSETQQDKVLSNKTIEYIKGNPVHFIHLCIKKFYYFLWFAPNNLLPKEGRMFKKLFEIPYGIILMSGILGVFLSVRRKVRDVLFLVSILISVTLLYSIFIVGNQRYRMPVEPYLLIFSSVTWGLLWEKYKGIQK